MRYLLDTCAMVFIVENTGELSPAAETRLKDPGAEIWVSAVSVAELACGQERGRIKLAMHWKQWWAEALRRNGWDCLSITPEIMAEAWSLPGTVHGDPADRLFLATARVERMTLVTTDRKLLSYPHADTLS
jgi:PIN domain nuclease of toxin-antitoxin system